MAVEYDGTTLLGFQRQSQGPTVQSWLEDALGRVADHPVEVFCSGRTDSGVHAAGQVVHFDTTARRSERAWILGCNHHLPGQIAALWIRPVPEDFHARFSARWRRYRYRLLNRWVRPALDRDHVAWVPETLDADSMDRAARALVGRHDFSAFRAAGCQAAHSVREVFSLNVTRSGTEIHLEITANAFLYHMVRNIVGTLLEVGRGGRPEDWPGKVLASGDRRQAGPTAPAGGLSYLGAHYDPELGLPTDQVVSFPRGWNLS